MKRDLDGDPKRHVSYTVGPFSLAMMWKENLHPSPPNFFTMYRVLGLFLQCKEHVATLAVTADLSGWMWEGGAVGGGKTKWRRSVFLHLALPRCG